MSEQKDRFDVVERTTEEREAAARDLGHILFGPPSERSAKLGEAEGEGPAKAPPGPADAGERGDEPEERKSPGELLFEWFLDTGVYKDR